MQILTLKFWQAVWIWCKVNWKFLAGFGIPIIIGVLMRKNQQTKILQKGLKFRKEQLEIERKDAGRIREFEMTPTDALDWLID